MTARKWPSQKNDNKAVNIIRRKKLFFRSSGFIAARAVIILNLLTAFLITMISSRKQASPLKSEGNEDLAEK